MIPDRAIAHVLCPLSEPLPPTLEQRSRQVLEALEGLDAKDRLELACRTVLHVLNSARPRFRGANELVFNTLCAGVLVADGAMPPHPGELKGTGFFGGTPAEAQELALRYLGACLEQN